MMIDLNKDFSNMKILHLTNSSFQNGIVPSKKRSLNGIVGFDVNKRLHYHF